MLRIDFLPIRFRGLFSQSLSSSMAVPILSISLIINKDTSSTCMQLCALRQTRHGVQYDRNYGERWSKVGVARHFTSLGRIGTRSPLFLWRIMRHSGKLSSLTLMWQYPISHVRLFWPVSARYRMTAEQGHLCKCTAGKAQGDETSETNAPVITA
jgi:hypothetical protein